MEIKKIDSVSISRTQFAQIVTIESICSLEPYTPEVLWDCIVNLDTFACFENADIVGFITVQPRSRYFGGSIYIVNLNVAKTHRRQGIAQNLILATCRFYKDSHKGKLMSLDVCRTNKAALALYQKMGFEKSDLASRNGDTDIVMAAPMEKILSKDPELPNSG